MSDQAMRERCDAEVLIPGEVFTVNCFERRGHLGQHRALDTWGETDVEVYWDE